MKDVNGVLAFLSKIPSHWLCVDDYSVIGRFVTKACSEKHLFLGEKDAVDVCQLLTVFLTTQGMGMCICSCIFACVV